MTGEEIRQFRIRYLLTQEQLADLMDVSVPAVRSWEQGHRQIKERNVRRLKRVEQSLIAEAKK